MPARTALDRPGLDIGLDRREAEDAKQESRRRWDQATRAVLDGLSRKNLIPTAGSDEHAGKVADFLQKVSASFRPKKPVLST